MSDIMTIGNSTLANDLKLPPRAKVVLRHLEKGKSITPMEALMVYNIGGAGLAHAVYKLREAGHDVLCDVRKDERGHGYGRYTLNKPMRFI
jgi:hypothetical protein